MKQYVQVRRQREASGDSHPPFKISDLPLHVWPPFAAYI